MPDVSAHPSAQALALFGHGKLSEAQAATVAAHLETCADCRKAVTSLPPDSFVGKVRAAKPGSSSLLPSRPGASPSRAARPAPAAAPRDLPAELACHPKFRIVRELGRGGMGVIYLAEHRVLERPVAIKVISPTVLDNPDALARFHAEAKAAGKLDEHPNIARAYDADQAGELHFLVMEYVEGMSLAQVLERRGPLPIAHACHYIRQAALGLQHAFDKGMVHRDIKPQNLMLAPKNVVKVLDFGLARLRDDRKRVSPRLTQLESFMGTPEYVAPEQAMDAREADTRSDIYSLGCTLYALLTGQPPFVEDTIGKLVLAHVEKEPVPLHEACPEVPAELSAVVAKMLAKDPAQRYQRPDEVAQALAPFAKARAKAAAAGAAAAPSGAVPADAGTRVGGDTSRVKALGASRLPAKPAADEGGKGSPFEGLAEASAAAPKRAKKAVNEANSAPAAWWKRPAVMAGAGVAVLLLVLVSLWAAGTFRVKMPDGTVLVIEVNEPNPDVFVDGEKITVTWSNGGKQAEISRAADSAKVEVRKDGFTVSGEKVELKDGRRVLTVTLVSVSKPDLKPAALMPDELVARVKGVAGIELVSIPQGTFYMGSPPDDRDAHDDEKPQHRVTISQPFYLGKCKVTVGQFRRYVEATGYKTEAEKAGDAKTWKTPGFEQTGDHPVVAVSWNDAGAFCQWLAKEAGARVRLPREAEWEYSCRAKTATKFYFGDNEAELDMYAWHGMGMGHGTKPCGLKLPNAFGLYDMHGLAGEWCADGKRTYKDQAETDPEGPTGVGAPRVIRGGSVYVEPRRCRAASRPDLAPSLRSTANGFRVLVEKSSGTHPQTGEANGTDGAFVSLFNGKDIETWRQPAAKDKWRVQDGILIGDSAPFDFLTTQAAYKNFRLLAEVQINDSGAGSIIVRNRVRPISATGMRWQAICEPTTHRYGLTDSASLRFCRSGPTAPRLVSVAWTRQRIASVCRCEGPWFRSC
jgi:formylglycine-generating enzyme required for sulfatase activity/predicted Ser/Thr protein kinase